MDDNELYSDMCLYELTEEQRLIVEAEEEWFKYLTQQEMQNYDYNTKDKGSN